jgi:hypothetical protein
MFFLRINHFESSIGQGDVPPTFTQDAVQACRRAQAQRGRKH